MIITSQNKNPVINFTKIWFESSKTPKYAKSENTPLMHEKMHVKQKINEKKEGTMDIPAQGEKNLARRLAKNDNKSQWSLTKSKRERGKFEKF